MPWTLRIVHGASGQTVTLPEVDERQQGWSALQRRIHAAFKVEPMRQRLRAGVPPRVVESMADLHHMDRVLLEEVRDEGGVDGGGASATARRRARKRRRPSAGPPRRLGTAVEAVRDARAEMGQALAAATTPGSVSGPNRWLQPFRWALREALTDREADVQAEDRFAAALAGTYRLQSGSDGAGAVSITYPKQGARRAQHCDQPVHLLSDAVLRAVVTEVSGMPPEWRENLRPFKMARVSPAVFWSLVQHCRRQGASGNEEALEPSQLTAALQRLAPDKDWRWMERRQRAPPARLFHGATE
ncbi:hypothetical protein CDCA_CDCA19G4682 [Cyanidium caldarium]|uniref:Ubiquitin-like domain-containing protein n=1 Tax=Cyanidium caldarium TaxID=2771 RepID=A0AAV9J272_CYACA|nr:hypothetical protein CDCA_CDCA19G4682 [Cyanidium caldarium]